MPRYFAHISHRGPVKYGDVPSAILVLDSPDQFAPIGKASSRSWNDQGLALWTLLIGKDKLPGRWIIKDREFIPASS
jgi:hypothetical protein